MEVAHEAHGTIDEGRVAWLGGTCVGDDGLTEGSFDAQGLIHEAHITVDKGIVALIDIGKKHISIAGYYRRGRC